MRKRGGVTLRWMGGAALALVVSLGSGCAGPNSKTRELVTFEVEPWNYGKQAGRKYVSPHYEIFTTIRDEALTRALPELMEVAFEEFQKIVPPTRAPAERMKVYLFATRAEWAYFTKQFTGPRARQYLLVRNGGYSHEGVSVIQYAAHQTTMPIMAHEGFHQYLHHYVNTAVPAWLNEGLAVYFEGQRWGAEKFKNFDPWYNPLRRNILAEAVVNRRLFALPELLDTNAGRVLRLSTRAVGTYYAQLWALVLFLKEGENGKYVADLERLLGQLGAADLEKYARAAFICSQQSEFSFGQHLFRCFIADDLEAFEKEYRAFIEEKMLGGKPKH